MEYQARFLKPLMRVFAVGLLVAVGSTPVSAQTVKTRYERALQQEKSLRGSGKTNPPLSQIRDAMRSYELLVRKHPTSGYADDALWQAAGLASLAHERYGAASDQQTAGRLLRWLVSQYPHSKHVADASARLKALESPSRTAAAAPATTSTPTAAPPAKAARSSSREVTARDKAASTTREKSPATSAPGGRAALRSIERSVLPDVERLTIELDREVLYAEERLSQPPRLFFDLQRTQASSEFFENLQTFDTANIRQIRLGHQPNGTTRVVLDLAASAPHNVFTLYNPYRLVVDFPRAGATASAVPASAPATPPASRPPADLRAANTRPAPTDLIPSGPIPALPVRTPDPPTAMIPVPPAPRATPRPVPMTPSTRVPSVPPPAPTTPPPTTSAPASPPASATAPAPAASAPLPPIPKVNIEPEEAVVPVGDEEQPPPPSAPPTAPPRAANVAPLPTKPIAPASTPTPQAPPANATGGMSMARQLGLGVSRIVIDAGHGGHDPGARGANMSESEIVLDVALRLEKLLKKEPGFEVVLTRNSDVFVPLEERTAIANRANADLFLSIHANASRNRSARGVETYFLNFATNSEAEAVAARENAASGQAMNNLPRIVQAIALNNKVDESRDFAGRVQEAMVSRLEPQNKAIKNLGVKQAPFVVLIGASMPSVLAEISFLTNQQEGQLLKNQNYRQRIAQALFDAVTQYQQSLKAVGTAVALQER